MNEKQNFLKTSLLTFIKASVDFVFRYWMLLSTMLNILIVGLLLIWKDSFYKKMVTFMVLNFIFVITYYLCKIYKVQKNKFGFPIRDKRYTRRLGDMVYIVEKYKYDAILYLNEIEDHMENLGVYVKGE